MPEPADLDDLSDFGRYTPATCPDRPHRGPQGPNEDLSQCPRCWGLSWEMRPEGQTFGLHASDCSLPERHESFCAPGGDGHPEAATIRGYFKNGGAESPTVLAPGQDGGNRG